MSRETGPEPNVTQAVPFFAVADLAASLRYYVDGLGFTMRHKWVDEGTLRWCWLQLGSAAVMLQQFRTEGHDAWVPQGPVGEGVSVYFLCRDALAIYQEVRSRGVPAQRPFVGNHMWVTGLTDPDGYRLFFESPTEVSEETVFAEPEPA